MAPGGFLGMGRDNAVFMLAYVLSGAAGGLYLHVLPLYVESLGASPDQVGLALALGAAGGMAATLAGGAVAERFSYRIQILGAWSLSVGGLAVYAVAPSWQAAIAGMVMLSATNFSVGAVNAYIAAAAGRQRAGVALGNAFTASAVGGLLTPPAAGLIVAGYGFRALFLVAMVLAAGSLAMLTRLSDRRPDPATSGAAPAGRGPRAYAEALGSSRFRELLLALGVLYAASAVGMSLLANYLHDRVGLAPAAVAAFGTGVAAVTVVVTTALTRLAERAGALRCLALAQGLIVLSYGLALLAPGLGALGALVGGVAFAARGIAQTQNALSRGLVAATLPPGASGGGFALQQALFTFAQVVGPLLAGQLYLRDPALPLVVSAGMGMAVILRLATMADPTRPAGG